MKDDDLEFLDIEKRDFFGVSIVVAIVVIVGVISLLAWWA